MYPFRMMGGLFDMGFPWFGDLAGDLIVKAISKGADCLFLCTYHFSEGDNPRRGCKGSGCDIGRSRSAAFALKHSIEEIYGRGPVYPIVVGVETDSDALIFHDGSGGDEIDIRAHVTCGEDELRSAIDTLYYDMKQEIRRDLLPIVVGNVEHVRCVRASRRTPLEMNHLEQAVCVGRGFDWLHLPNKALIIGPFSSNWEHEIYIAGTIVDMNLRLAEAGTLTLDYEGAALVCASSHREGGIEKDRALMRARYFERVATHVLRTHVPSLKFRTITGTVDMQTRFLNVANIS